VGPHGSLAAPCRSQTGHHGSDRPGPAGRPAAGGAQGAQGEPRVRGAGRPARGRAALRPGRLRYLRGPAVMGAPLLVVVGPTAVGKTAVLLELAPRLEDRKSVV